MAEARGRGRVVGNAPGGTCVDYCGWHAAQWVAKRPNFETPDMDATHARHHGGAPRVATANDGREPDVGPAGWAFLSFSH